MARNVALAGHGVGGDSHDDLAAEVSRQADAARNKAVHIVTPHASYDTTAEALGLSIDQPNTVDAVMKVGHKDNVLVRPFRWVASLVSTRKVAPAFQIDRLVTADGARAVEGNAHVDPTEPSIKASAAGAVEVVPGKPGVGIEPNQLADALVAAAPGTSSTKPIEVHVDQGALAPQFTDADAERIADEANTVAHHSLTLTIGSQTKPLDPAAVASWLRAVPKDGALTVGIDDAAAVAGISALFGTVAQSPVDASFTVEGGKPVLHPSQDGAGCCEPGASQKVFAALQTNTPRLTLSVVTQRPKFTTEAAQQLGIVEEVGQPDMFGPTTHHACCQPRVTNIHLIADIVRGHVIQPGETFSVNGFVGQRTAARGFVDAPVIYNATEDHDIGGGVSQFATTMFNASFFSGLDLVSYQSHSLYLSRYPRGREADHLVAEPRPEGQELDAVRDPVVADVRRDDADGPHVLDALRRRGRRADTGRQERRVHTGHHATGAHVRRRPRRQRLGVRAVPARRRRALLTPLVLRFGVHHPHPVWAVHASSSRSTPRACVRTASARQWGDARVHALRAPDERRRRAHVDHREGPAAAVHDHRGRRARPVA